MQRNPAPESSAPESVIPEQGGFVTMLVLDMDTYAEKYGNKAVRKNLTIPAWLNTFAEKNGINFSQVLQDSLVAMYQKQYNWLSEAGILSASDCFIPRLLFIIFADKNQAMFLFVKSNYPAKYYSQGVLFYSFSFNTL